MINNFNIALTSGGFELMPWQSLAPLHSLLLKLKLSLIAITSLADETATFAIARKILRLSW